MDEPTDLRSSVASGVAWQTLVAMVVQALEDTVSSLVLVRLLEPSEYGMAAMVLTSAALINCLQDFGFSAALIQRPTITEADRSTVFWTSVAGGLVLNVAFIGLSGVIAVFYDEPRLQTLAIAVSFTFLIGSLGVTQSSLLHRAMKFREVSIRLIIATVAACATAVAVAAAGGGVWALIAYELALSSVVTVLLWQLSPWRPRFVYSWTSVRNLSGFGLRVTATSFLQYLQNYADYILIGRFLGTRPLGLYTVSFNVILIPLGRVVTPVANTLFPAVSRIQSEPARVAHAWIRALRCVLAIITPAIVGLFVVTPDFVETILGHQWADATPIIRILSFVTIVSGLAAMAESIMLGLGRAGLVLRLGLANTTLAIGAFVVGVQWGVIGVAACFAAVMIPLGLVRVVLVNRMVGVSTRTCIRAVSGIAEATLLMAVVCWLSLQGLEQTDLSTPLRLLAVVLIGFVTYVGVVAWRDPALVAEIKGLLPRRGAPQEASVATTA